MGGSRILVVPLWRAGLTALAITGALLGVVLAGVGPTSPAASSAPAPSYAYATMSDGTKIAVVVSYPAGYVAGDRYPTLFEMDGYDGGGGALDPSQWDNRYVMVHASVRGTGCSTGQFDLFSWADADDGAQIVERWIPTQAWSDGDVGIIGHSYPGLTGFMTAERIGYDLAQPGYAAGLPGGVNHLKALALSGLIDDLYAGITYMGGIPDLGFPLAWAGFLRPESEVSGNYGRIVSSTEAGDPSCLEAYAQHEAGTTPLNPDLTALADNPIVNGATDQTEGPWWSSHSLDTYLSWLPYTDAPLHVDQQYQDEQTGPRGGARLFQELESLDQADAHKGEAPLPYRIVLTNGRHDSAGPVYHPDEQNWLDCYEAGLQSACRALGQPDSNWQHWTDSGEGGATYASTTTTDPCPGESVVMYFETTGTFDTTGDTSDEKWNPPLCAAAFPVPGTAWTRYYLNADGSLATAQAAPGARSYLSTTIGPDDYLGPTETGLDASSGPIYAQAIGPLLASPGPEELSYETRPFSQPTTLEGPIEADLYATSSAPDTDYFVQLVDVGPGGAEQFLQYGLLRASLRAVDPTGSQCASASTGAPVACGSPGAEMYWPDHPYTNSVLLTPEQLYEASVEVFPLGWVFRPGHSLLVTISAPPLLDQLYSWAASARPVGVNTIESSPLAPSSILLPLVPAVPDLPAAAPACGAQVGVRCTTPAETATPSGLPGGLPGGL
jgi:predicted acyl esterase